MAEYVICNKEDLVGIADAIREITVAEDTYGISEMTDAIKGLNDYYDEFWDAFQNKGKKRSYLSTFIQWDDRIFKPKYDLIITTSYETFKMYNGDPYVRLEEMGRKLDTSGCANLSGFFNNCYYLTKAALDLTKATNVTGLFYADSRMKECALYNIPNTLAFHVLSFGSCTSLESLTLTGVIGKSGLKVDSCPLNVESLLNIIDILEDKTGSTGTFTVTLGTDNQAKLTEEQIAVATEKGWTVA